MSKFIHKYIISPIDTRLVKFLQKRMATPRPSLNYLDSYSRGNITPSLGIAYFFENEVTVFSTCILKLSQEMFRNGFEYEPSYLKKCYVCGTEYDEDVDECSCGSQLFGEADESQLESFDSHKRSFMDKANYNDQSLKDVLKDFENNLNIADNAYLMLIKSYLYAGNGDILETQVKEILSVDPRTIAKIVQPDGRMGGKIWICPTHRSKSSANVAGAKCAECGAVLREAYYETTSSENKQYYLKDEVFHSSKYYPSILYGFPPALKMVDILWAYHHLEKRTRVYYEKGRAPGILMIPTNNQASLNATFSKMQDDAKGDPYNIPAMGIPAEGRANTQYINLMSDPNADMLGVKKELRERISTYFGVSLIFQNDTSTSGGLNNEGLQINVTGRPIEDGQTIYNEKMFPWLFDQFGIEDYVLRVKPSEEDDVMAEKQQFSQDISNARQMYDMGYDVEFKNGVFEFTGEATPASERNAMPQLPTLEDPYTFTGEEDVAKGMSVDDGNWLVKDFTTDALKAIAAGALYQDYADTSEADVHAIHKVLTDSFEKGDLSLDSITAQIVKATGIDAVRAEMIARTETSAVTMKAREIGWKKLEEERGEEFKFKTSDASDTRVSDTSKLIAQRINAEGGAVTLDKLKQIYKEVSTRPVNQGGMGPSWTGWESFVAHPNERSTIVRVV